MNDSQLFQLLTTCESHAYTFHKKFPSVLKFWRDGFHRYLRKMKEPKNIHSHPRRYFHLHAMQFVLQRCKPEVIWNLAPGNIRTIFPVLEQLLDSPSVTYLINIDVVPEIKNLNIKLAKKKWPRATVETNKGINIISIGQLRIINSLGTIEDFFDTFNLYKSQLASQNHVLLCVDGISNVVVDASKWVSWWEHVKKVIHASFSGFYITWLNSMTLDTKFEFYFNVTLQKHHHPLHWVVSTSITNALDYDNGKIITDKLSDDVFNHITVDKIKDVSNYIFSFYSDSECTDLVYQTFYITNEALLNLTVEEEGNLNQFLGHRQVDSILFDFSTSLEEISKDKFVKSIPYLAIKQKIEPGN